jgi:hypothetical protein
MRAIVIPTRTTDSMNTGISGGGSFFPKRTAGAVLGGAAKGTAGCFVGLLVFAFYAACALIVIALAVWAWHYLFG